MNFWTFDDTKVTPALDTIHLSIAIQMNSQLRSIYSFENALHYQYPELDTVSETRDRVPEIIRQSRFYNLWKIAKKFQSIFYDTIYLEDAHLYSREIEKAFYGVIECCKYVFSNINNTNVDDHFLGITFVLVFLTEDDFIQTVEEYQTLCQWNLYHSMFSNGTKNFIIQFYDSVTNSYNETEIIMNRIFGEASGFDKQQAFINIFSYMRHLPDNFVPYPYNNFVPYPYNDEDEEESDDDDVDEEAFEPYTEPHSLFFDAPLRPLLGECCICFKTKVENYIVTHCRHTACQECAVESIRRNACCWLCRTDLEERNTFLYHGSEEYHTQNKDAEYLGNIVSEDLF